MSDNQQIAHEIDRVMRKIDAQMHRRMPAVDEGRIGPMGALLLMQLESMEPCSIQAVATAIGRDNSQLTRLIRSLEKKGVLRVERNETDRRSKTLTLTAEGRHFLLHAKKTLAEVVEAIVEPLDATDKRSLLAILGKL